MACIETKNILAEELRIVFAVLIIALIRVRVGAV